MIARKHIHKIRNFLQVIVGQVGLAESYTNGDERRKQALEAAKRDVKALSDYLESVTDRRKKKA